MVESRLNQIADDRTLCDRTLMMKVNFRMELCKVLEARGDKSPGRIAHKHQLPIALQHLEQIWRHTRQLPRPQVGQIDRHVHVGAELLTPEYPAEVVIFPDGRPERSAGGFGVMKEDEPPLLRNDHVQPRPTHAMGNLARNKPCSRRSHANGHSS